MFWGPEESLRTELWFLTLMLRIKQIQFIKESIKFVTLPKAYACTIMEESERLENNAVLTKSFNIHDINSKQLKGLDLACVLIILISSSLSPLIQEWPSPPKNVGLEGLSV